MGLYINPYNEIVKKQNQRTKELKSAEKNSESKLLTETTATENLLKISERENEREERDYPVMTPDIFEFLSSTLPAEGGFTEAELEDKFRAICREVKRVFPDYCRDSEAWVKSAHYLLFYGWTKTLTETPHLLTPSRLKAWDWLFDRFSQAIDRAESESRRLKAVAV